GHGPAELLDFGRPRRHRRGGLEPAEAVADGVGYGRIGLGTNENGRISGPDPRGDPGSGVVGEQGVRRHNWRSAGARRARLRADSITKAEAFRRTSSRIIET